MGRVYGGQCFGAKKVRNKGIILSKEEQGNEEEGWSWKKTGDNPLSYTLTLDNANFQVPDNSAVQLYVSQGFPIEKIDIVLKGENQLVSNQVLNDSNLYQCTGIYFSVDTPSYPYSQKPDAGDLQKSLYVIFFF